jgi:large subunit ribosomal protein L15
LDVIQSLIERKNVTEITPEVLLENGLISRNDLVKVLGRGELSVKISVSAHKFSGSAKSLIEALGGNCSEL